MAAAVSSKQAIAVMVMQQPIREQVDMANSFLIEGAVFLVAFESSSQLVGKFVIDVAVTDLIFADCDDDLAQPCIGRELPVIESDLG